MKRSIRACTGMIAMILAAACLTGCDRSREFRDAAGSALHSGVSLILDGLVDGVFAVIEPDTTG